MRRPERKSPGGNRGSDLLAGDPPHDKPERTSKATLIGVSPVDGERVRVWSWAPDSIVLELGVFGRESLQAIASRIMQRRPGAQLFVAKGAAL